MKNYPIDFVVLWVDSSDISWQESFKKHSEEAGLYTDFSEKRYRDWGLFKYWFRGVEKYAPWVNKVHLVTNGQYPEWLNLEHPKLNLVSHKDYISKEHLPVFSSHPIELNMHRIKDLAEHFVYFNDDMFIKSVAERKMFFKSGLPCDSGVMNALNGVGVAKIAANCIGIINKNFSKTQAIKKSTTNWFNIKYGKNLFRNFLLTPWTQFTGFYDYHLPNPYLKSTLEDVWEKEFQKLHETTSNKFRGELDVSQYLFRYWQLASNKFSPIAKQSLGDFYMVGKDSLLTISKCINSSEKPLICLNDHDPENLDHVIETLVKSFEINFPNKSTFEI